MHVCMYVCIYGELRAYVGVYTYIQATYPFTSTPLCMFSILFWCLAYRWFLRVYTDCMHEFAQARRHGCIVLCVSSAFDLGACVRCLENLTLCLRFVGTWMHTFYMLRTLFLQPCTNTCTFLLADMYWLWKCLKQILTVSCMLSHVICTRVAVDSCTCTHTLWHIHIHTHIHTDFRASCRDWKRTLHAHKHMC